MIRSLRRTLGGERNDTQRSGRERTALHKEPSQGELEVGDGTARMGKGGLEMSQNLCRRRQRRLGRLAPRPKRRADQALAEHESLPDPLHLPVAQMAVDPADGCAYAVSDNALQKLPQTAGRETQPADLVRDPNAERPPATLAIVAVAAEDPPGANRLFPRAVLIIATQKAVQNQ